MLRDTGTALLLVSIDKIEGSPLEWGGKALEAALGPVLPTEWFDFDKYNAAIGFAKTCDISIPQIRLVIPIADGVLPIHNVGYQMHHNLGVTKLEVANVQTQGGDPQYGVRNELTPGTNQTTLQFEMKSSLRKLEVLADFLTQQSESLASRTKRVTYMSGTLFIRDAILVGVNRATVQDQDKEIFTMTLEVQSREDLEAYAQQLQSEIKPVGPQLPVSTGPQTSQQTARNKPAFRDIILPGYFYYQVLTRETLEKLPVPDYKSTERVQQQNFRIFRVASESRTGNTLSVRDMVGIEYRGQLITLPEGMRSRYRGNYGLVAHDNTWYLAVKS